MKRPMMLIATSAAVYFIAAWWAATRLPERRVPLHVNLAGDVDRYTTRAGAISYFIGLGGCLLVLAVGVVCLCWWLPARFLNVPNKEYWRAPQRAPAVKRMIAWDVAVLFSMPLLALSFVPVNVVLQSENPTGVSALWILAPIGVWLLAMAAYVEWILTRRYRPHPT